MLASLNCLQKDKEKKMISKKYRSAIAAFVTLSVWGFVATGATGKPPPSDPRARPCDGIFTFVVAHCTHWKVDQRIVLTGPPKSNGNFQLVLLPSTPAHETLQGPYAATAVSPAVPPDSAVKFTLTTRVQSPGHSDETPHPQVMEFVRFDDNECPVFVRFDVDYHDGDKCDDHGGHAGAGRW